MEIFFAIVFLSFQGGIWFFTNTTYKYLKKNWYKFSFTIPRLIFYTISIFIIVLFVIVIALFLIQNPEFFSSPTGAFNTADNFTTGSFFNVKTSSDPTTIEILNILTTIVASFGGIFIIALAFGTYRLERARFDNSAYSKALENLDLEKNIISWTFGLSTIEELAINKPKVNLVKAMATFNNVGEAFSAKIDQIIKKATSKGGEGSVNLDWLTFQQTSLNYELVKAIIKVASFTGAKRFLPTTDSFFRASGIKILYGFSATDKWEIRNKNIKNMKFKHCDLRSLNFEAVNFTNIVFEKCTLSIGKGCTFNDTTFINCFAEKNYLTNLEKNGTVDGYTQDEILNIKKYFKLTINQSEKMMEEEVFNKLR